MTTLENLIGACALTALSWALFGLLPLMSAG